MATPHYRIAAISRGSSRAGKVRRPASLGGSMARRIQYIERGGDLASRADEVIVRGQVGPPMADWSGVDRAERRRDAIVGRELMTAFPISLLRHDPGAMERVGREHAQDISAALGVPVAYAGHHASKAKESDPRNTHFHFCWPARVVNAAGQIGAKTSVLDNRRTSSAVIAQFRTKYQERVNHELAAAGLRERLDLRTRKAQGLEGEALTRIPKREFQRARRGEIFSIRYAYNQAILAQRAAAAAHQQAAADLARTRRAITARFLARRSARRASRRRRAGRTLDTSRRREFGPSRRHPAHQAERPLPHRADGAGPQAPRPLADASVDDQRRFGPALPAVDGGRVAGRDRGRSSRAAEDAGSDGMVGRPVDRSPTERGRGTVDDVTPTQAHEDDQGAAMAAVMAQDTRLLVQIDTTTGGRFFAHRLDLLAAIEAQARDVLLCNEVGEPVVGAVGRARLRMSTVKRSEVWLIGEPVEPEPVAEEHVEATLTPEETAAAYWPDPPEQDERQVRGHRM